MGNELMVDMIRKVVDRENLTEEEAQLAMGCIMDGKATDAQIAGLATALRMKGETVDEITGFARAMIERIQHRPHLREKLLDTCGTGGDGGKTFNISTASAIVAASAGARVAKHGNRSVSSQSGSADVLEELGVSVNLPPDRVEECLERCGFAFYFAPQFHPAMKHAARARSEMKIRTIFNLLGPLTNPARARRQILGVYDASLLELLPRVLQRLGVERALVVASADGLDEVSISAPTHVAELHDDKIRRYTITPEELGLDTSPLEQVRGGDAKTNAQIIQQVFDGTPGPAMDIILANAGAALYLTDLASSWKEGVGLARHQIQSGAVREKLQQICNVTEVLSRVS